MPDRLPCPAQEPAEHRHAHEQARHQRAHVARVRVFRKNRGLDHGAVPWQNTRVVGNKKSPAGRRNVFHASGLDAPVVAVQDHEDRQERLRPLRVESEFVNLIVRAATGQLLLLIDELGELHRSVQIDDISPGQPAKPDRQLAEPLKSKEGRLALEAFDGPGEGGLRFGLHDLGRLARLAALFRCLSLDHLCASRTDAGRCPLRASRRRRCR